MNVTVTKNSLAIIFTNHSAKLSTINWEMTENKKPTFIGEIVYIMNFNPMSFEELNPLWAIMITSDKDNMTVQPIKNWLNSI